MTGAPHEAAARASARPLPTLKLKLSVVILAAVAVTVVVFWAGVRIGVWPSVGGVIAGALALVGRALPRARHDLAAAGDGRRQRGDGARRLQPARHRHLARRDRHARALVQPDGGRARRDRPRAPRPRRQRQPRAAHADHRAAGGAREPGRRRRAARSRDAAHDARPGRAARPARAAAARPVAARVGRRAARPARVRGRADARARGPGDAAARGLGPPLGDRSSPRTSSLDGDAERLHQVVANLVENAVRHSPPDGEVAVARACRRPTRCASRSPTKARASPTPRRRACSNASTAPTAARSSDHGGAGLGLAIARWIVDLHDGDVHVETVEPHGARMVVTLPGRVDDRSRTAESSATPCLL